MSNEWNNIQPRNSFQTKKLSDLVLNETKPKNDTSTTNAKNIDNYATTSKPKATSQSQNLSYLIKSFAVVAVALVTGVVGVSIVPSSSVSANFEYVQVYDSGVFFEASVNGYKEGLKVILTNDFTSREQEITEEFFSGYFEGLQENMYYTLSIVDGSFVLAKKQVYTHFYDKEVYDDDYNQERY